MNKRGEMDTRVVLAGIVALFVLFILLFYGGKYITKEGGFFDKVIPNFGIEKKVPADVKIVRYDIVKDSLSYYDGVKFISLDYKKDDVFSFDSGTRKVGSKYLRQRFIDKFYNSERPDIRQYTYTFEEKVRPGVVIPKPDTPDGKYLLFKDYIVIISSPTKPYFYREFQGGIIFDSINNKDIYYGGVFVSNSVNPRAYLINLDNSYFRLDYNKEQSREKDNIFVYNPPIKVNDRDLLGDYVIKWRDYVLTKPIEIEVEGGERVYVCVEKIAGFLSIDLDKGVDSEYECSNI